MSNLDEHAENRGVIETILRKIPGFSGYLMKEARRDSDALARQWIADQLQKAKNHLDGYSRGLLDAGSIDHLPQLERVRAQLDRVQAKVQGAPAGYSGFFDLVRVDEELLIEVYEHDKQFMESAEEFANWMGTIRVGTDEPQELAGRALEKVSTMEEQIDMRSKLLQGFDPK